MHARQGRPERAIGCSMMEGGTRSSGTPRVCVAFHVSGFFPRFLGDGCRSVTFRVLLASSPKERGKSRS